MHLVGLEDGISVIDRMTCAFFSLQATHQDLFAQEKGRGGQPVSVLFFLFLFLPSAERNRSTISSSVNFLPPSLLNCARCPLADFCGSSHAPLFLLEIRKLHLDSFSEKMMLHQTFPY